MKKILSFDALIIAIGILLCALIIAIPITVKAYFEAKAFNRLTGKNATTWEAIWVELRVQ